ncbi:CpxP family protein, partial [Vibrio crassostreae]
HQMMSVLTPEQKTQLKEIQQERMTKCADKMEKRMNKDK